MPVEQLRENSESTGGSGYLWLGQGQPHGVARIWPSWEGRGSFSDKGTWMKDVDQKMWGTHLDNCSK